MTVIKAACIQMNSGADIQSNLDSAAALIRDAAAQGATLIATPEVSDQVISNRAEHIDDTYDEDAHPGLPFFSDLARELEIDLIIGSMIVRKESGKIANRCFAFDGNGRVAARYDKIHLYDVDLPNGESHRESKVFDAGQDLALWNTGVAQIGLSICYDLRFAYLYRDLAKLGAQILSIPAAFTVPTGRAHWETLLRARAIETGCFVLAPAQSGDHDGARETYGHTMIIAPWGEILARAQQDGQGVVVADLDLSDVEKARAAIPALKHDSNYTLPL